MKDILLVTDSNCNLEDGLIEKWGSAHLPSLVTYNGVTYKDGVDISAEKIYEICATSKVLPKTAAVNASQFQEYFEELLKDHEQLVFITIASALSSGNANAHLAVENMNAKDRILVLDSENLSCGISVIAERVYQDIQKGMSLEEIEKDIDTFKKLVNVEFVIDTLDNLYKGGRCSGLAFLFGNAFHIHPIIGLKDGKMNPIHKIRDKHTKKGMEQIIADFKVDLDKDNVDFSLPVYVTDARDPEMREFTYQELKKICPSDAVIRVSDASSVIAVHCGARTTGIGWAKKHL